MHRPTNIRKLPVKRVQAPNHRPRTRVYGEGEDPDINPEKYELFYTAFCISGGSVEQAYTMASKGWDETRDGPKPTREQLIAYARHNDWRHRFLQQMLDPDTGADFSTLADAALRGMELLAVETIGEVARGDADPKVATSRLKAAQTILFLKKANQMRQQTGARPEITAQLAREIQSGESNDLTPEEIARRTSEDWERERPQSARTPRPLPGDGNDTTVNRLDPDDSETGGTER